MEGGGDRVSVANRAFLMPFSKKSIFSTIGHFLFLIKLEKMPYFLHWAFFKKFSCSIILIWGIFSPKIGHFFRSEGLATLDHRASTSCPAASCLHVVVRRWVPPPPL